MAGIMGTGSDTTAKRASGRPLALAAEAVRLPAAWQSELRLCAAVVLCLATLWFVDLSELRGHLARLSLQTVAGMIALHCVIVVLTALRFARIARGAGATVSTRDAFRLTFGSTLANMLLPTSLAGDAGRVWLIQRHGLTARSALGVGVFDRVIGLASLGLVVLGGALFAPSLAPLAGPVSLVLFVLVSAAGLAAAIHLGRAGLVAATVGYSLAAHAVSIAIAYVFLLEQPADVGLAELAALFPAVLLAASIPVSVGGWGTRELAAAAAFGVVGMDATVAIALAFAFGVTQTVAAGIGSAVLWPLGASRGATR
jgi:uncharacterized membrane protein YbhN (UPF0104 family)